ncbi:MAG: inositol monophosphatase family protein [Planctomycetota bacterium]|jgi:myo-inositol-1(or 4)-monophosphatase
MHPDQELAIELAHGAGKILLEGFERFENLGVSYKGLRNPVTEVDEASEAFIRREIAKARPGDRVLGEEGGEDGGAGDGGRLWIVDPLDGTVNFMHGHPVFAVSIGLAVSGRMEVGVVHVPKTSETFHAARGGGARLGDKELSVSNQEDMGKALLATGFAYNRSKASQNNLDNFSRLSLSALGIRRMGAAAVDLAYVAAGIYDGFWEIHLAPWDVAAGGLVVSEAGGRVTDFAGGDGWLHGRNIVASNGSIHDDIRDHLTPFKEG